MEKENNIVQKFMSIWRKEEHQGRKNEGKIWTLIFLFNLIDSSLFKVIPTVYSVMYTSVLSMYVYISASVYLYISKMNNSNDKRARRKELRLFCYYEVHYLWSSILLFESEFGLIVNVYWKF